MYVYLVIQITLLHSPVYPCYSFPLVPDEFVKVRIQDTSVLLLLRASVLKNLGETKMGNDGYVYECVAGRM